VTIHFVGRNSGGDRLFVEMNLRSITRAQETITHDTARGPAPTISITGMEVRKRASRVTGVGQIANSLYGMLPANGWTNADIASLRSIWKNWHLNELRAGCAHMRPYRGPIDRNQICPESGYHYGSKWLYAPIPDATLREFKRLMALPTNDAQIPEYVS
jgi:hypothetical protein